MQNNHAIPARMFIRLKGVHERYRERGISDRCQLEMVIRNSFHDLLPQRFKNAPCGECA